MEPVKLKNKSGAEYMCHTEERLEAFKKAGWVEVEPITPPAPDTTNEPSPGGNAEKPGKSK